MLLTVHHIGDVAGLQALEEGRVVAVARISHNPGERHTLHPRLIHQHERQFELHLKGDRGGHMDWAPAGESRSPGFLQVELRSHRPMHRGTAGRLIGQVVGGDNDLAIGDLAQGARILAGHPDRTAPLLRQPSIVQHQQTSGRTLRHQGLHALLVERLWVPGGSLLRMMRASNSNTSTHKYKADTALGPDRMYHTRAGHVHGRMLRCLPSPRRHR